MVSTRSQKKLRQNPYGTIRDAFLGAVRPSDTRDWCWKTVDGKRTKVALQYPRKRDADSILWCRRISRVSDQLSFHMSVTPLERFVDGLEASGSSIEELAETLGWINQHARTLTRALVTDQADRKFILEAGKLNIKTIDMLEKCQKNSPPPPAAALPVAERKQKLMATMEDYAKRAEDLAAADEAGAQWGHKGEEAS